MKNKPTYREQYDKLLTAYINDQINPFDACACFVGNLLNKESVWSAARTCTFQNNEEGFKIIKSRNSFNISLGVETIRMQSDNLYDLIDIIRLERMFLNVYEANRTLRHKHFVKLDEDALFIAFEKTLDLLKKIHIDKGEIIDEVPVFVKRKLKIA